MFEEVSLHAVFSLLPDFHDLTPGLGGEVVDTPPRCLFVV